MICEDCGRPQGYHPPDQCGKRASVSGLFWADCATTTIARLRAELASRNDPQWDGTDAAHPAWWRGADHAAAKWQERTAKLEAELASARQKRIDAAERWTAAAKDFGEQLAAAPRWQRIGVDPPPDEGQWCVLLAQCDDELDWSKIVQAKGDDWEQAICGSCWSRHEGDVWLAL